MWNPDAGKHGAVNLSTVATPSSSGVLASVRAQRQAREQQRRYELAAGTIQRVWRGRQSARDTRARLLDYLETQPTIGVQDTGRVLMLLGGEGDRDRAGAIIDRWAKSALEADAFARSLGNDEFVIVLALLLRRLLVFIARSPRTVLSAELMARLVKLLSPAPYRDLDAERRRAFVDALGGNWVKIGVGILDELVVAGARLPKKQHPLNTRLIPIITAPFAIEMPAQDSPLVAASLQDLLTVPSLPSVLPLSALTHLLKNLPLFGLLLPAAVAKTALLDGGRLSTELGKTYFLANLATLGITGKMLQANGPKGTRDWISVVGTVLSGLGEGWGRWAEGTAEAPQAIVVDSDSDEDVSVPAKPRRDPLPENVSSKLLSLTSPDHLGTLAGFVLNAAADQKLLADFSAFVLGILTSFRGSPRWEGTLDAVMEGKRGAVLTKLLWREGVRGKWGSGREAWDTFSQNPNKQQLLLLSHIYCHYLLLTPDDEFFSRENNALSIDEVLDLSSIWRDLAFWGYMNGVARPGSNPSRGVGPEEVRSLFTRGVTRVSERNARRKFAADEFWVMKELKADINSFVDAVKYEDSELDEAKSRALSRRQLAYIAPRLGLLNNLPMAVPFETRVDVFREFIKADRERLQLNPWDRRQRFHADIRRTHLAEDGFRQLNRLGPNLKGMIQITFIDQHGLEEMGIDGGGLFKEFLTSLSKEAFDTERGLWLANDNNELYPNPHSYATEPHQLEWYAFIGRVLGKALYEDILVDVSFAGFFLAKWLGRQSYLDDLASMDHDLYRGLISVKNYPRPEELSLNFTVTEDDFGVARSIDLVPGGSEISVTSENRAEYIQLVCKYKLDRQFALQSRAFFAGLSEIIDPRWLRMFDQLELAQLLGGEEADVDLVDLRRHTVVSGFAADTTPEAFWRVVATFTPQQKGSLLKFVTSCARPPLLGFKYLNPGFAIRNSGADTQRLPTASSCANLLKLPDYKDERLLRDKLLQAIESGAGFDMS